MKRAGILCFSAILLLSLLLGGCGQKASAPVDLQAMEKSISIGESKEDVVKALGEPQQKSPLRDNGSETYQYTNDKQFLSILFVDGKVVKKQYFPL